MDVVLNRLEAATISPNESDENISNFDGLYKNWGKLGSQDERRREILVVQKSNRNSKLDKFRGILELVQAVEENDIFKTANRAYYRPSIYVAGFNKASTYSQVLMMSEWLIEKPCDFEDNWLVVPSPKGTRTLVVANNGITRLFSKYGHLMHECRTGLPGGNPCDPKRKSNCCVLDGFYQKKTNVLYVMDILAWNSQPMTDGELEFRDFWLRSQFSELGNMRVINKKNELVFSLLPKEPCTPESLNKFMMEAHFDNDFAALDGLLFFHKKAHYFSGETPLVGWLFPFMVPEVLGNNITVNPVYMLQKPTNYTNQAEYIIEFNKKSASKNSKSRSRRNSTRSNQMDTADLSQPEIKPKKSTPKPQKAKTESMEAEASLDASDDAALLLSTTVAESAMDDETAVVMVTETSATVDAENGAAMDAEIEAVVAAKTPVPIDTATVVATEKETRSVMNVETLAAVDAETVAAIGSETVAATYAGTEPATSTETPKT